MSPVATGLSLLALSQLAFFICKSPMLRVYGYMPLIFPSQMKPLFLVILAYSSLLEGRWLAEKRMAFDLSFLQVAQHLDMPTLEITICYSLRATRAMLQPALVVSQVSRAGRLYFARILLISECDWGMHRYSSQYKFSKPDWSWPILMSSLFFKSSPSFVWQSSATSGPLCPSIIANTFVSKCVSAQVKSSMQTCHPHIEAVTKQWLLWLSEQARTSFSGKVRIAPINFITRPLEYNLILQTTHFINHFYFCLSPNQLQELIQMTRSNTTHALIGLLYYATLVTSLALEVDKVLPELKTDIYTFSAEDPVNVTMREQFTIGVSQFDIQKIPDDLKVYEISQEKFINMFQTLEKHPSEDQYNKQRKEVDKNIFSCSIRRPSMEIVKTLNVFPQKPSNKFSFSSEKGFIYVPVRSRQLLYTLDTATLEVEVYHFSGERMNFLSSAKINTERKGQKITMGSGSNQDYVYVFSNAGMWSIATQTVLTNVQKLSQGLGGFSSISNPVDKISHGAYGLIYALKRHSAVYVIPEESRGNVSYRTISKYGKIPLIPQDLYVDSRLLYILDMHEGIFVFRILGTGDVAEYDHISWRSYGNLEINAKQSSVFVRYLDQEGQKIVELNYNSDKHEASLVRYYKSDQVVFGLSVQTVPVFSSQRAYTINQAFIFFVADNGEIEIYPYNVDPRLINTVHNGVKMHVEGVTELMYLYEDLYVIVTAANLLYVRIRIEKSELVCSMRESTGHVYYQMQFSSNISTCENYDSSFQHKARYNSNCKLLAKYIIYVDDPDLSRFQKGLLYGVVFLVVASFIIGLLCLIQWRNNQLSLIGRIKEEIIKLRDRYRKMQPFTEEEPEHPKNSVEFELPEALPIPDPVSSD